MCIRFIPVREVLFRRHVYVPYPNTPEGPGANYKSIVICLFGLFQETREQQDNS